jgi:DNA polymerase III delta subunit
MAPRERIFLFHGSDSLASSRAVSRWVQLFAKKHGTDLLHTVHADEMDALSFATKIRDLTLSQGLFAETSLVLIKRPTSKEKGSGGDYSTALRELLGKGIPETMTVVIWEELELPETHSLVKWFVALSLKQQAGIKLHRLAPMGKLMAQVKTELAEANLGLSKEAEQLLASKLTVLEKSQRLTKQLKAQEVLKQDERSWWLHHVLESLILSAPEGKVIGPGLVAEVTENLGEPVGIFEVSNAITSRNLAKARSLLAIWEVDGTDDANYFRLFHLLRRDAKRGLTYSGYATYMLQLLAQVELLVKNGFLSPHVATDMLCIRLQHATADSQPPIIDERVLWLGTLQRSGN